MNKPELLQKFQNLYDQASFLEYELREQNNPATQYLEPIMNYYSKVINKLQEEINLERAKHKQKLRDKCKAS